MAKLISLLLVLELVEHLWELHSILKEQNQKIKTVIVEPEGSILNGGESGPHKTEGIGMEFLPEYMDDVLF